MKDCIKFGLAQNIYYRPFYHDLILGEKFGRQHNPCLGVGEIRNFDQGLGPGHGGLEAAAPGNDASHHHHYYHYPHQVPQLTWTLFAVDRDCGESRVRDVT